MCCSMHTLVQLRPNFCFVDTSFCSAVCIQNGFEAFLCLKQSSLVETVTSHKLLGVLTYKFADWPSILQVQSRFCFEQIIYLRYRMYSLICKVPVVFETPLSRDEFYFGFTILALSSEKCSFCSVLYWICD